MTTIQEDMSREKAHSMIRLAEAVIWVSKMEPILTDLAEKLKDEKLPYEKVLKRANKMASRKIRGVRYLLINDAADLYYMQEHDAYPVVYLPSITGTLHLDLNTDIDHLHDMTCSDIKNKDKSKSEKTVSIAQQDPTKYVQVPSLRDAKALLKHY